MHKVRFVGVVVLLVAMTTSVHAGYILQNGQVVSVANTTGNTSQYKVGVIGGTGVCANSTLTFNQAKAGNEEIFKRGFALALTALATGHFVRVYSYEADNCSSAAYIEIHE